MRGLVVSWMCRVAAATAAVSGIASPAMTSDTTPCCPRIAPPRRLRPARNPSHPDRCYQWTVSAHRVAFLVYDGVTLLDLAGPAEVFKEANRFGAAYPIVVLLPPGADATPGRA